MPFLKDLLFFSVVKYHSFQTGAPIPFFWVLFPDWLPSPLYTDMLTCPLLLCSCQLLLLCLYFFRCFPSWLLKVDTVCLILAFCLSSAPSYCLTPCCTCWLFTVNWPLQHGTSCFAPTKEGRGSKAEKDLPGQSASPDTHGLCFLRDGPSTKISIKMTVKDGGLRLGFSHTI